MMRTPSMILRNALAAMSVRLVAMQLALALLVFSLAVVWLRLPDSSALSVLATILLGLLLVAFATSGEVVIMVRLCGRAVTSGRLLKGGIFLLAGVALWFAWAALIGHFQEKDMALAGYLSSRLPESWRNIFSYWHIYQGLEWMSSAMVRMGAGVLAVFAYSATVSTHPASAIRCALRSTTYWVALLVGSFLAPFLTGLLMQWTPGHDLGIEMVSLILRLGAVTILDSLIVVFLLAVLAACILYSDSTYVTPAGGPERSQPRTDEIP